MRDEPIKTRKVFESANFSEAMQAMSEYSPLETHGKRTIESPEPPIAMACKHLSNQIDFLDSAIMTIESRLRVALGPSSGSDRLSRPEPEVEVSELARIICEQADRVNELANFLNTVSHRIEL